MLAPKVDALTLTIDGRDRMKRAFRPIRNDFELVLTTLLQKANFASAFTYLVSDTISGGSHHKGLKIANPVEAHHAVELRYQLRSSNERFKILLRVPRELGMDVFEFHTRLDIAHKEADDAADAKTTQESPQPAGTMQKKETFVDDPSCIEMLMVALEPSGSGIVSRPVALQAWEKLVDGTVESALDALIAGGHLLLVPGSSEFLRVSTHWLNRLEHASTTPAASPPVVPNTVAPPKNLDKPGGGDDSDPNWRQVIEPYLSDVAKVVQMVDTVYRDSRWEETKPVRLYRGYAINAIGSLFEDALMPRSIGRIIEELKRRSYLVEFERGEKRYLLKTPAGAALLGSARLTGLATSSQVAAPTTPVTVDPKPDAKESGPLTTGFTQVIDQVEQLKQQVDSAKKYREGIKALDKKEQTLKDELASVLRSKLELEQKLAQVNDAEAALTALRAMLGTG